MKNFEKMPHTPEQAMINEGEIQAPGTIATICKNGVVYQSRIRYASHASAVRAAKTAMKNLQK